MQPTDNDRSDRDREALGTVRRGVAVAAVLGFLAVALGAFGAHGIKGWLETVEDSARRFDWWQTATQYLFWHALLAVAFGVLARWNARARVGTWLCVAGSVLFSGSLYVMTLTNIRVLGAITPLGGLCFLAAWLWLWRARPASVDARVG